MKELTKIRWAISMVFFGYGLCFSSWAARIPSIQQALQLSDVALGSLLLALPVGSMVSLPISGFLVAKYGSKRVAQISSLLYACALVGIGFAPNLYLLPVSLFTFSLLGNMLNIAINTQAVALEKRYEKNIMASFHGMWSLAGFAGAGIGALMIALDVTPSIHYLYIWLFALVSFYVSSKLLLNETASDTQKEKDKPTFAWPDKALWVLGIIVFCSMICEGAMFDWSGIYLDKVVKVKEEQVGIGYTFFMISMASTRFMADRLTHYFGLKVVLRTSGLFTACGLLIAILFPSLMMSVIGFLLVGVGVSSVVPLVYSVAGKTSQLSPGIALAAVSTLGFLGFLVGPPMIGFVAGLFDLRASFVVLILMALVVTFLSRRV